MTAVGVNENNARAREAAQREANLQLARDEAVRAAIEPVADTPGWEDTTQEALSGGLHLFAYLARTYDGRQTVSLSLRVQRR